MRGGLGMYRNVKGTTGRQCSCGTWKEHWMKNTGRKWPEECSASGCNNPPEVGAHVVSEGFDKHQYIIPLCKACNNQETPFAVKSKTVMVSANKQKTCDK